MSSALSDESCPSDAGDSLLSVETGEPGELDALMLGLWNMCNDDGLFRYDVTACSTKVLPGMYGFIAQLNEGRATKKRPTEFRVDQVKGQDFQRLLWIAVVPLNNAQCLLTGL